jgi:hypothetical protein
MAAAIARLRDTTGLPVIGSSRSYRARICDQSVSSILAAQSCTAAIAACSWYSPTDPAIVIADAPGHRRPAGHQTPTPLLTESPVALSCSDPGIRRIWWCGAARSVDVAHLTAV